MLGARLEHCVSVASSTRGVVVENSSKFAVADGTGRTVDMHAPYRLLLILVTAFTLCGCSSARVLRASTRSEPAIRPEQVSLFGSPPAGSYHIGVIMAESCGRGQGALDRARAAAQKKAAEEGITGLAVNQVGVETIVINWWPIFRTHVMFDAFMAPQ